MEDLFFIDLCVVCGLVSGWALEHRSEARLRTQRVIAPGLPRRARAMQSIPADHTGQPTLDADNLDDLQYLRIFHAVRPTHWN